jgi:hypothetical protein
VWAHALRTRSPPRYHTVSGWRAMIDAPSVSPELEPKDLVDCPECKRLSKRSVKVRRVAGITLPGPRLGADLVHDAWCQGATRLDLSPQGSSESSLCAQVYRDWLASGDLSADSEQAHLVTSPNDLPHGGRFWSPARVVGRPGSWTHDPRAASVADQVYVWCPPSSTGSDPEGGGGMRR